MLNNTILACWPKSEGHSSNTPVVDKKLNSKRLKMDESNIDHVTVSNTIL